MTRVRFTPNPLGVDAMLADKKVASFVNSATYRGKQAIQEATPVRTGDAKRSVRRTLAKPQPHGLVGTVYSTDPFWHLIEYGSIRNTAYAPMRRGVQSAGFQFEPKAKGD